MIQDEFIQQILPISDLSLLPPDTQIEDLGSLLIFPGLIDLNVSFSSESANTVTKQAASGGTTLISTLDPVSGELYTDVAPIIHLTDNISSYNPEVFAYKAFLVPQGPNSQVVHNLKTASEIPSNLPLIVHPELATAEKMNFSTPYRQIEPEKRVFDCKIVISDERNVVASEFRLDSGDEIEEDGELENSESCSEDFGPEIVINTFDGGDPTDNYVGNAEADSLAADVNSMCLNVPNVDRKRVSLPTIMKDQLPLRINNSPRSRSFQVIGINNRPIPIQDIPFIKKGIQVEQAYHEHISKFPPEWETAAVKKVFQCNLNRPIHFSNVCSAEAIEAISRERGKEGSLITCETSLPYIYFSELDVKPGDTRYKLNPPIRDHLNFKSLWQYIKNGDIDCISSYHQPVAPPSKFIGDFTRAVNGVISAGFLLQGVWTRLRSQVSLEDEGKYLSFMSSLLSKKPAEILGLSNRGGISKGKIADLVVWDPDSSIKVLKTFDKFPEMSPMIGEELYGVIHRTYLRGNLVFNNNEFVPKGKILTRSMEAK